ncbi:MAG TPA: hypothetical protein VJB62_03275, partial [Patescibacteria group bacterium]|nr:hypothetical protein [Patescibacteria group bacterium]
SAIFDNTVKIDWTGATLLPQDVGDHHVYVEVNGKLREYLGRSGSNKFLFWPAVTQNSIAPKFRSGPMVPSRYCLGVAAIKGNPRPWVWSKEVFLLPNSLSALAVIDAASTLTEVKEVDEDLPMDRELMIVADFVRIGFDSQSATTVHWQVSVNGRPWDYLGQSIPTDNFLRWRPGASSIALNYRSGPQFGNTYLFRAAVFQRKGGKRFTIASVPVEFKQQAQKTVQ